MDLTDKQLAVLKTVPALRVGHWGLRACEIEVNCGFRPKDQLPALAQLGLITSITMVGGLCYWHRTAAGDRIAAPRLNWYASVSEHALAMFGAGVVLYFTVFPDKGKYCGHVSTSTRRGVPTTANAKSLAEAQAACEAWLDSWLSGA